MMLDMAETLLRVECKCFNRNLKHPMIIKASVGSRLEYRCHHCGKYYRITVGESDSYEQLKADYVAANN